LDSADALSSRFDAHPCSFAPHQYGSGKYCLHFRMLGLSEIFLDAIEAEIFAREKEN
jgi:hypothetical protein